MWVGERRAVVGVAVMAFTIVLGALSTVRALELIPSTSVQSRIVYVGAFLVVVMAAFTVYDGGGRLDTLILSFGPSLAFMLNALVPVWRGGTPLLLGFAVVGAIFPASLLAALGYAIGYTIREA